MSGAKIELLVGSDAFFSRLQSDIGQARSSVFVQTFTFEGDRVGWALTDALDRSGAADRRLLVDRYSLLYHSDRWIHGPAWFDPSLRREVQGTREAVARLREGGAHVRFANPLGPSPVRLIRRNHKKLASIDDRIAYVGGINFSDHNFAWHDMMIRIECPEVGLLLADDFRRTWDGRPCAFDHSVGPFRFLSLDGRGNDRGFRPVVRAIDDARTSIDVVSAYLSAPFTGFLGRAARRGVRVRVLSPSENNKPNLSRHLARAADRFGLEILRYSGGMSHLKAMVIDDELLIAGSTNFDFMSYTVLEEYVLLTRATPLVEAFRNEVWQRETERASVAGEAGGPGSWWGDLAVRSGARVASLLARPGAPAGTSAPASVV